MPGRIPEPSGGRHGRQHRADEVREDRLPLSFALGYVLPFGIAGVYAALPVEYYVRSLIIVPRFTAGAWKATPV